MGSNIPVLLEEIFSLDNLLFDEKVVYEDIPAIQEADVLEEILEALTVVNRNPKSIGQGLERDLLGCRKIYIANKRYRIVYEERRGGGGAVIWGIRPRNDVYTEVLERR